MAAPKAEAEGEGDSIYERALSRIAAAIPPELQKFDSVFAANAALVAKGGKPVFLCMEHQHESGRELARAMTIPGETHAAAYELWYVAVARSEKTLNDFLSGRTKELEKYEKVKWYGEMFGYLEPACSRGATADQLYHLFWLIAHRDGDRLIFNEQVRAPPGVDPGDVPGELEKDARVAQRFEEFAEAIRPAELRLEIVPHTSWRKAAARYS